ncbi:Hypothetical protein R9X50_00038500 [Acrodontium crateriforme]|uniref:Alpha/beta-hydrolase n=1 Tax=Acrodontium crateriforme TaxID=150365 RepID=A0AAQ3LXY5_9PEZI|nr:Hypothetical protein R9X50_00038500 [Acrodontium crateriforme]
MSIFALATIGLAALQAFASPTIKRDDNPSFVISGDAPFSIDTETLSDAITCPNGNPTASKPPVLLIHGTSCTGEESWGKGYVPALMANGYTACYVTLPNRAMSDMQISAEYVAYGLHYVSWLSGGLKPSVISHSQGGPVTQWALQFWPSAASVTKSFIALSPDFMGVTLLDSDLSSFCVDDLCQASLWQQSAGSNFYSALHKKNFNARVPTTTIWSEFDGIVTPIQSNARLPGATVIQLQDLCILRPTNHIFMTIDSAAYAIALDALNNNGNANVNRIKNRFSICLRIDAPHMDLDVAEEITDLFKEFTEGFV